MLLLTRFLSILGVGMVLALPLPVHAQTEAPGAQRVAIAKLQFEGRIPEVLQALFARRLLEGLSAARFEVLSEDDVRKKLEGSQSLSSCGNANCYPAIATKLSASYLITAHVAESNKTYTVTMEIINGRTGGVLASNRERCETCGVEEAGEKMGLAASALRERLEAVSRAPARFIVKSRPAGATVLLDGRPIGVTPLDIDLHGGQHQIQLTHPGYDRLERTFISVSGVDETMDFDMVAIPSKFPFRTAGYASIAGGILLIAAGAVAISYDKSEVACSRDAKDVNQHCPQRWNTRWWSLSLMGLGASSATLGGVLLFLDPTAGRTSLGAAYQTTF